jgi:hypothetical protein
MDMLGNADVVAAVAAARFDEQARAERGRAGHHQVVNRQGRERERERETFRHPCQFSWCCSQPATPKKKSSVRPTWLVIHPLIGQYNLLVGRSLLAPLLNFAGLSHACMHA